MTGGIGNLLCLAQIDVVAANKGIDGGIAQIVMVVPAQQVVQHAQPQRAFGEHHPVDVELLEDRAHDGEAAEDHGQSVAFHPG